MTSLLDYFSPEAKRYALAAAAFAGDTEKVEVLLNSGLEVNGEAENVRGLAKTVRGLLDAVAARKAQPPSPPGIQPL